MHVEHLDWLAKTPRYTQRFAMHVGKLCRDMPNKAVAEMERLHHSSGYPKCDYATWNEPVSEPCPNCGWPILTIKTTKRRGTEKVCPQQDCSFAEPEYKKGKRQELSRKQTLPSSLSDTNSQYLISNSFIIYISNL